MIIHSNISNIQKYHNGILYEPIEKQIYNELLKLYDITYEITDKIIFKINYCNVSFYCKKRPNKINSTNRYNKYGVL